MQSKVFAMAIALAVFPFVAEAADLNKAANVSVDYVKVCDAYGSGFFYIPGSDTCLKLGGRVYADIRTGGGTLSRESATNSVFGDKRRSGNPYFTRTATYINLDARTSTDLGLLRTYLEIRNRFSTGANGTTELDLTNGYVQWGGLFAGKMRSAFDFTPAAYTMNMDYGNFGTITLVNQLGYTLKFGNGLSGTIALLDSTTGDVTFNNALRNETTNVLGGAGLYGGNHTPDIVANLNIAQAWGSAQLSGAAHQDYSVGRGEKEGFAATAGVEVLLPSLAQGDKIAVQAGYALGAIGYISPQNSATGNIARVFAPGNYIDEDWAIDANGRIQQSSAWGGIVSFHHEFNPNYEFNLDGTYLGVNGYQARDTQSFALQTDIRWKPTGQSNFYIALAAEYGVVDFTSATKAAAAASGALNPGIAGVANAGGWETAIRINRTF